MEIETAADPRWASVLRRDRAADGAFVYAVRTTGIYCRPSCPARRPRSENVAFFADGQAAARAGFRPCRRCQPDGAPTSQQAERIAALCRWIEAREELPGLEAMARQAGWSPFHLHRVFRAVTGLTPKAWADAHRAGRLRRALREEASVTGAIHAAGYGSSSRLYERADALLGMRPTRYRDGGAEETIRFAVAACSLGALLVAATERGICAIALGDDPAALVADLERRFPNAALVGGDEAFEATVARVVGLVEQPRIGLDLPLDVRGTAFQRRVWEALRAIPPGSTATYAEIAAAIGMPRAVRAVAAACAANAIAVAIPCHRVVRKGGALSGYRWGVERKRALLEREAASPSDAAPVPGSGARDPDAARAPGIHAPDHDAEQAPRSDARKDGAPHTSGFDARDREVAQTSAPAAGASGRERTTGRGRRKERRSS